MRTVHESVLTAMNIMHRVNDNDNKFSQRPVKPNFLYYYDHTYFEAIEI